MSERNIDSDDRFYDSYIDAGEFDEERVAARAEFVRVKAEVEVQKAEMASTNPNQPAFVFPSALVEIDLRVNGGWGQTAQKETEPVSAATNSAAEA